MTTGHAQGWIHSLFPRGPAEGQVALVRTHGDLRVQSQHRRQGLESEG